MSTCRLHNFFNKLQMLQHSQRERRSSEAAEQRSSGAAEQRAARSVPNVVTIFGATITNAPPLSTVTAPRAFPEQRRRPSAATACAR